MSGRGRERGEGGHQYGGREGWQAHYANQGSREGQGQRSGGQGLKDIHGPRGGQGFKGLDPEARSWTPGLREQNQDPRDGGQRPRQAGRGSREPQRFRGRDEGYRNGGQERSQEGERPREAKVAEGRPEEQGELGSDLTERLSTALTRGTAECLVCLERVRQTAPTWDCQRCFQVFHLPCIKRWAKSAVAPTGGWRCPGCQAITDAQPADYRCFCRKVKNPEWGRNEGLVPHTCGAMCGRTKGCGVHHCTELCHPGRCPPCTATVLAKCHPGDCEDCGVTLSQACHCGATTREAACTPDQQTEFSCGATCPQLLACGRHPCTAPCHSGDCAPCPLEVAAVTRCPCSKTSLEVLYQQGAPVRQTCLDPVPVCDQPCNKVRPCGAPSLSHLCSAPCHEGPCPPCALATLVRCRCGHMDQELPCNELTTKADDARCGKQCKAKRLCGRHKCGELCCILVEHPCPLTCGQLLSCGKHRCEEPCHRGKCPRCPYVSFDELACRCGAAVTYPPVDCGVRPPECSRICSRPHGCSHPITHNCHSEDACPPCTTLVKRRCFGGHEERKNLACHIEGISCGRPCDKDLACGRHRCVSKCHPGACPAACTQPCRQSRPCGQGHYCGAPCHEGPCPNTPCTTTVSVRCECGHRSATVPCAEDSYSRVSIALLQARLQEEPINLAELKRDQKLECSDECYKLARNAGLAEALQVVNPELSSRVLPRYTDLLKDWARRDPQLCASVHAKLTDLVKLALDSKHKSRSFSFPNMNREKRQMVHEYSKYFGITTQSFDAEPMRNVIATAERAKVSVPTVALAEAAGAGSRQRRPAQSTAASKEQLTYTDLSRKPSGEVVDWFG